MERSSHVFLLLCSVILPAVCAEDTLHLLSRSNSGNLEKYQSYVNTAVLRFLIPEDVSFVSFKFVADEISKNLFDCYPRNVSLYLTRGAPPVINPDGSKFPSNFVLQGKPEIYSIVFKSDNQPKYINLTAPYPGLYYAATFNPYTNLRDEGITQHGLSAQCMSTVDAYLFARSHTVHFIKDHVNTTVSIRSEAPIAIYKLLTPDAVDHILISLRSIEFCAQCKPLLIKVGRGNIQMDTEIYRVENNGQDEGNTQVWVKESEWYYIVFEMDGTEHKQYTNKTNITSNEASPPDIIFHFSITYYSSITPPIQPTTALKPPSLNELTSNLTAPNTTAAAPSHIDPVRKQYRSSTDHTMNLPYVEHALVKGSKADSFLYTFDLQPDAAGRIAASVNVTGDEGQVLTWRLQEGLDVGGTLQIVLGIKPVYRASGGSRRVRVPTANHTLIACISAHNRLIPMYPDRCHDPLTTPAAAASDHLPTPHIPAIVLNRTSTDDSVQVPYPESGPWYIAVRLFCDGACAPCRCPVDCKARYTDCVRRCEMDQDGFERGSSENDIRQPYTDCNAFCRDLTLALPSCADSCDCIGGCARSQRRSDDGATAGGTATPCNSSVLFDVSSYPCVQSGCGSNGKCVYMLSEGFVHSSCSCRNNYRGWDCMDDSTANSFSQIVLELLLLVFSNIMFLPAAFFAYRRRYYAEMVVYLSTCFFSSFYHYCDAGENIVSLCILPLYALQFCDFYCGLLGIWVTLVAMAYLPAPWPSILHMLGAIILGCFTTYDKQSIWVFVVPAAAGSVLILATWTYRFFRTRRKFPSRRYLTMFLPVGLVIVALALLMYATLQTRNNYKYVHSAWHILMAIGVIILLPDETTFVLSSHA